MWSRPSRYKVVQRSEEFIKGMLGPHVTVRRIVVMNAKGGSGKSTVATNVASYYASHGYGTALFDFDPQGSSTRWLRSRPKGAPAIYGAAKEITRGKITRAWTLRVPPDIQRVVIDTPAGLKGSELIECVKGVDIILVPVLPSPIDIHSAADFVRDLLLVGNVRSRNTHVAIVANRVKTNTLSYQTLKRFLSTLKIPVIAHFRDSQSYVRAFEQGQGIHELKPYQVKKELAAWNMAMPWIEERLDPHRKREHSHGDSSGNKSSPR